MMVSKEVVRARLQQYNSSDHDSYRSPHLGTAAVLVPLLYKDGDLHVLLTVRSSKLKVHQGEVCFPGGKFEAGDKDSTHTALREAQEEIGLPPESVGVLATISPIPARSGLMVTPVVGFIPNNFQATPNEEVADIFTMPLKNFLQSEGHTSKDINWKGIPAVLHYFDYKDNGKTYVTFGLTATIALMVAIMIYQKGPEFQDSRLDVHKYLEGERGYLKRATNAAANSNKL